MVRTRGSPLQTSRLLAVGGGMVSDSPTWLGYTTDPFQLVILLVNPEGTLPGSQKVRYSLLIVSLPLPESADSGTPRHQFLRRNHGYRDEAYNKD